MVLPDASLLHICVFRSVIWAASAVKSLSHLRCHFDGKVKDKSAGSSPRGERRTRDQEETEGEAHLVLPWQCSVPAHFGLRGTVALQLVRDEYTRDIPQAF
jgi:hypothetical protein